MFDEFRSVTGSEQNKKFPLPQLNEENVEVFATWKTMKLVNLHSTELVKKTHWTLELHIDLEMLAPQVEVALITCMAWITQRIFEFPLTTD